MRPHLFKLTLVVTVLLLGLTIPAIYCTIDEKASEILPGEEILIDEEVSDFDPSEYEDGEELPPKQDYPPLLPPPLPSPLGAGYPAPLPPLLPPPPAATGYSPPQVAPVYQAPVPAYPPQQSYQQQSNYVGQAPQPAAYGGQPYSDYASNNYSTEYDFSYQIPYASNFSPPIYGSEIFAGATSLQQLPVYQQQQQQPIAGYPQAPVYQKPYVPAPVPLPVPAYNNYSKPTYQPPSQPQYQPVPLPAYKLAPVVVASNYSSNSYQQPQPIQSYGNNYNSYNRSNYINGASYRPNVAVSYPIQFPNIIQKYSLIELSPFIPLQGYVGNHWSLFYYRSSPYKTCPKNIYLNPPSYKDIEAAFAYANQQLSLSRGSTVSYLNSSAQSWAARHQVFSFLNQQSARMDEEGLLIELISQYLSDRACLTKWDKQRYLPTLTKFISTSNFPYSHSCSNIYQQQSLQSQYGVNWKDTCLRSRYRNYDGFCNNIYHPYWGKSNVCHIRLLSPDYADGISAPRTSYNYKIPLPNPRLISNYIHNDVPIDGPYNLMKMQWGQFINHDITNTALSSYDGLVDCCKNPGIRGCWPIYIPPGDKFYGPLNVTCLSFIRSGVCPLCELGPRQQINKNTAFLDLSHIYGNTLEQAQQLRLFKGGLLKFSLGKNGEILLPISQSGQESCSGVCFLAGDNRVNQHPALTALHTLFLRNHNQHARGLAARHPQWADELIFQEARRLNIAEYQMITYGEYLPIVFGPILSNYYKLLPNRNYQYTYYEPKADPTTWNEYSTASCRFGHSQISSTFGLYNKIIAYGQQQQEAGPTFRLKDWFMRPSFLSDGLLRQIILGLIGKQSLAVDPWITTDVHNHLYQSHKDLSGGDLAATNIWRGRDHGIPGYVYYLDYCFNFKAKSWKDLSVFIPPQTLAQLRKLYKAVENIDLFTGGLSEFHFPGADTGPTFACINGIQYYHLKFGDRYFFEHGGQAGSYLPHQLEDVKKTTLARILCRTSYIQQVPQYAFLQPSVYNPIVNCSQLGEIDYNKF